MPYAIRIAIATALCLVFAPSALAASISRSGDTVTVAGTSSAERFYVTFEGSPAESREVAVSEDTSMTPGSGCKQGYPGSTNPQYASCGLGVTKVVVNAGDGDDLVFTGSNLTTQVMEFNGEGGRDDLRGGPANDVLSGGPGNDNQILGDQGNDVINGGDGDDVRLLGDSDITPVDKLGADVINGGAGNDTLDEERNDTGDRAKFWSLDGVANDGTDRDDNRANGAEEGDNVMPDVENVMGGYDDDIIIGNAANNKLHGGSVGNDILVGLEGDDELFTGITGEGDSADGGPGNDKVQGNHDLKGGPGNDEITGQGSNDQIDGGPGLDTILAGDGNDVVQAVDGEVDQIGCGPGGDIANADTKDVINTTDNGQICETIKNSSPPAGGGPGPNSTGNPNASLTAVLFGAGKLAGGTVTLDATLPGAGILQVTLYMSAPDAKKVGLAAAAKPVKIGSKTVTSGTGGKVKVKVKLTSKAAKKLKRKKSVKVTVKSVFTPVGGKKTTSSKKLTLKR